MSDRSQNSHIDLGRGYALLLSLLADYEGESAGYTHFRSLLINYFERKRLSPGEDLADDTLLRAAQHLAKDKLVERGIAALIYSIARNVAREEWRTREKTDSLEDVNTFGESRPA